MNIVDDKIKFFILVKMYVIIIDNNCIQIVLFLIISHKNVMNDITQSCLYILLCILWLVFYFT